MWVKPIILTPNEVAIGIYTNEQARGILTDFPIHRQPGKCDAGFRSAGRRDRGYGFEVNHIKEFGWIGNLIFFGILTCMKFFFLKARKMTPL